jgi:ATP-dependent Clp protease protease subunit
VEEVSKDTERDHWLDAEEAKRYGLVSRIVTSRSEL